MALRCEVNQPIIIYSPSGQVPKRDYVLERGPLFSILDVADVLNQLNQVHGGVLTFLQAGRGWRAEELEFFFCTPTYVLHCACDLKRGYAYYLKEVKNPDSLYYLPHWRAIMVKCAHWQVIDRRTGDLALQHELLRASASQIQRAFQTYQRQLGQQCMPSPLQLSSEHQTYLNLLDEHIDLIQQVEQENARTRQELVFVDIQATDAEQIARDTYSLLLRDKPMSEAGLPAPAAFTPGDFVWVGMDGFNREGLRERARVTAVEGRRITIKFYRQVSLSQIPHPGIIGWDYNGVQQRAQHQAVESLRRGKALNPHLLNVIVGGRYVPYTESESSLEDHLNPSQNRAVQCALQVEDMFLVLGPPGTGKTESITAMAKRLADRREQVLVTAKNNLAVDNVLVKLRGLRVVRIGFEQSVASDARHLLIDRQAQALQQEIVSTTEADFQQLEQAVHQWDQATAAINRLQEALPRWSALRQGWEEGVAALRAGQLAVWEHFRPRLLSLATEAQQLHRHTAKAVRRSDQVAHLLARALEWRDQPVVGLLVRGFSNWLHRRAVRAKQEAEAFWAQWEHAGARYIEEANTYRLAVRIAPSVGQAKGRLEQIRLTLLPLEKGVYQDLADLQRVLPTEPVALPSMVVQDPPSLKHYLQELAAVRAILNWRCDLLREWRQLLATRRQALYSMLIRSADVVGATCIGIATDARFRDLEFGTVIADEAGQVQAFDLLVPLVRARRAILVGDHRQLPPVVNDQVIALFDDNERESIALQRQSLFEQLFDRTPDSHRAVLDTQYRMPAAIADFISQTFYGGQYHSVEGKQTLPHIPLFSRPLVFVDTKGQCAEKRGANERTGYRNRDEARILARLAVAYLDRGSEIGIIVPYTLQVEAVRRALRDARRGLDEGTLSNLVATVDSFQGKERDVILFGFTRSNRWGNIGFLRELRRINVTMTRAKKQLVLLGDSSTLRQASDVPFQQFAAALLAYAQKHGQYMIVSQIEEALRE